VAPGRLVQRDEVAHPDHAREGDALVGDVEDVVRHERPSRHQHHADHAEVLDRSTWTGHSEQLRSGEFLEHVDRARDNDFIEVLARPIAVDPHAAAGLGLDLGHRDARADVAAGGPMTSSSRPSTVL